MKKILLPIIALSFAVISCTQHSTGNAGPVNASRFSALADSLPDEQIVDVRTPEEYTSGHINGAKNINWNGDNFAQESSKLDKSKPVMVYCLSGGRSAAAADFLRTNGFTNVYELQGGIMSWKKENLPVTQEETMVSAQNTSALSPGALKNFIDSNPVVLVDFSATWCGPCKRLAPSLDALEREMVGKFLLVRCDADRDAQAADSLNITALPTLMLYKNGKLLWRNEGLIDKQVIADQITAAGKN